jgi:RNA polymerase sigma-70 factor (ECF subfamily)
LTSPSERRTINNSVISQTAPHGALAKSRNQRGNLFNFDEPFGAEANSTVISLRAAKQSVEDRRRDIFDSHRHRVFALAYYMTGNEVEAEQILTGTFVEAFERTEEPAAHEVDTALVGELRARFPLGEEAEATEEKPSAVVAQAENHGGELAGRNVRRTDLEEAIQFLPPTERLLFLMRDVEGYSVEAIAKVVDMPEPAIQRTLFAARLRLRSILAQQQAPATNAAA